jgi:hypothetical protein
MHNVNIDVTFDQLYVTLPQKLSSIGKLQFRTKPNESVLYQTKARGVDDIKVKRETYIKIKSDNNPSTEYTVCVLPILSLKFQFHEMFVSQFHIVVGSLSSFLDLLNVFVFRPK